MLGSSFNIIGIDPGRNLGVALFTIDSNTLDIISIESTTYILPAELFLTSRLNILHNIIDKYLNITNPIAVGIETAFAHRFPKAVMQLSQYTAVIEHTIYTYNNNIKMYRLPPTLIKTRINKVVGGKATKDDMLAAVSAIEEITNKTNLIFKTEHEIDAIAIAYTMLQDIRQYPYYLIS